MDLVTERLMLLVPLVLSLSVHEWAHAFVAHRLGDDTAKEQGRLTLDPTAHIDLVGTILLPALGIPFGWAKPVPVDPSRFRKGVSPASGMLWTALAGPASNLVLAGLGIVVLGVVLATLPLHRAPDQLLAIFVQLNVSLALFNLLPIPPLDGSRVIDRFLPASMQASWNAIRAQGSLLLIGVVIVMNQLDVDLFAWPRRLAAALALSLAHGLGA